MKQLIVRVTEDELAGIKASVASAGISQNRWLRSRILGTPAGTPKKPAETPVGTPETSPEKSDRKAVRVRQLQAQGHTGPVARQIAEQEEA